MVEGHRLEDQILKTGLVSITYKVRHMLDNRELVVGGGTQPSTEPVRAGGLDGSAAAEERDNFHRDAHMNDRNHASGAPRPGCE